LWNERKGINEPKVIGYESYFEYKWDCEHAKRLIDESFIPCTNYYIANVGNRDPVDIPYTITNLEDWLTGSFDDLFDLNRLNLQHMNKPSLHLVNAERKREREQREAGLLKDSKVYG
jgi:hypothetical protein